MESRLSHLLSRRTHTHNRPTLPSHCCCRLISTQRLSTSLLPSPSCPAAMTDRFGRMSNGAEQRYDDRSKRRGDDVRDRDRERDRHRERGDRGDRERDTDRDVDRDRQRERDKDRDVRQRDGKDGRDGRDRRDDRDSRRTTRRSRSRSPPSRSRSRSRSSSFERRRRERKRKRVSGWDVPPSAEQLAAAAAAALTVPGIAPLLNQPPSLPASAAPSAAVVSGSIHPSRLGMVAGPTPSFSTPALPSMLINPATARQARRLYVGNLPLPINEFELRALFNSAFAAAFPQQAAGDAVVSVYLNMEKKFGFVEFRSAEEATLALQLDGIGLRGVPLRVKRPSDYTPPVPDAPVGFIATPALPSNFLGNASGGFGASSLSVRPPHVPGRISDQVPDGPNKLFCGGLPYSLPENDIKDLLSSYGELRGFHLKRDKDTGQSKGYAFFEYADPNVTDEAVTGLNNINIGERTLTVRRAQNKAMGGGPIQPAITSGLPDLSSLFTSPSLASIPTRVLVLLNMVVGEELRDAGEYAEIVEDVTAEMGKYGRVVALQIPREGERGCGKVYVEFGEVSEAMKARAEVEGRSFANRTVACEYMDADKFHRKEL